MRVLKSYGPSLIVLATAVVVLFAGPHVVRKIEDAQTRARQTAAWNWLEDSSILGELNEAYRQIADAVGPTVVHITTRYTEQNPRRQEDVVRSATGSGWLYDEQGHIVTNEHVVRNAEEIEVQLHSGVLRQATLVGKDPYMDIAVIKIEPVDWEPAKLNLDHEVHKGEMIFAFGSPFDFRFSMSSGIVSGIGRSAGRVGIEYQNFIQADAAINQGNSGGPLTNIAGEVIGMNTAIVTGRGGSLNDGQFAGIGLAIPVTMIKSIVDQLIEHGEVSRGFLGVNLLSLDSSRSLARARDFDGRGIEISSVVPAGPAMAAGVQRTDVITHIDGQAVENSPQLRSLIAAKQPGKQITLRIWRYDPDGGAALHEITVTLGALSPEQNAGRLVNETLRHIGLMKLSTSTEQLADQFNVKFRRGVIVEVIDHRAAQDRSIEVGAIITEVQGHAIMSLDEFYARLRENNALYRGVDVTVVLPGGRPIIINISVHGL